MISAGGNDTRSEETYTDHWKEGGALTIFEFITMT